MAPSRGSRSERLRGRSARGSDDRGPGRSSRSRVSRGSVPQWVRCCVQAAIAANRRRGATSDRPGRRLRAPRRLEPELGAQWGPLQPLVGLLRQPVPFLTGVGAPGPRANGARAPSRRRAGRRPPRGRLNPAPRGGPGPRAASASCRRTRRSSSLRPMPMALANSSVRSHDPSAPCRPTSRSTGRRPCATFRPRTCGDSRSISLDLEGPAYARFTDHRGVGCGHRSKGRPRQPARP